MVLRDEPMFALYLGGKVLSSCGIWIQNIAAAVLMYDLTRSSFMVGLVSIAQFGAPLLLSPWAGRLGDSHDRRLVLLVGRVVSGMSILILGCLIELLGVVEFGGELVLLIAITVVGLGLALSIPAMQAFAPLMVRPNQLEAALSLNSIAPSVARTVGPALGAGLLVAWGAGVAFVAAGMAHLAFASILSVVRPLREQPKLSAPGRLMDGYRYLWRNRTAGALILAVGGLSLGADTVVTLGPSRAAELGGGSEFVGLLASMFGLGALIYVATARVLRSLMSLLTMGWASYWVMAVGLVAVGLSTTAFGAACGMLVAGAGFMTGTVSLNTRIQRRLPEEYRSRVMAVWVVAFTGSRPIASAINGAVAELSSVRAAFVVSAILVVAASPLARASFEGQKAVRRLWGVG